MATITHAQYNSPMPLYSKENAQEVFHQTEGFLHDKSRSPSRGPYTNDSNRPLANSQDQRAHSARLDEQHDDYPHYRGFVDPRVQSPSFKRLQVVTGMDSGAEDDISNELRPRSRSRTVDDVRSGTESRQSVGSQHDPQQPYKPQWIEDVGGPRVAQRDPIADLDHDQPYDPSLAAKIAEAERPKVPPPVVPSWARKAEEKRQKWQQYGDHYQQKNYDYQAPRANWQPNAERVQNKWTTHHGTSGQDTRDYSYRATSAEPYGARRRQLEREGGGKREWLKPYVAPNVSSTKFNPPSQPSYSPLSSSKYYPPTKPQEFSTYYGAATNGTARPYSSLSNTSSIQQRSYSPYDYQTTYNNPQRYEGSRSTAEYTSTSGGNPHNTPPSQRKEVNVATLVSGEALNPGPPPPTVPSWSRNAEYKKTVWESKRTAVDPDYQRRPISSEPPPSWRQKAEQTHSLWQHEADAWRQRQGGAYPKSRATSIGSAVAPPPESGYGSRATSERRYETRYDSSSARPSPSWHQRPVPHEMTTYTGPPSQRWQQAPGGETKPHEMTTYTGPPSQRWQQAPGGETRSQSSGSYYDKDGNQVSYTKEVYTSSDPGKDYSMLSEQEKKILEEPLQPGVVSRHVTTKYYKKTTYNSSTTTSTSQTPPVTTTVSRQYPTETTFSRSTRGVSEY